ncbi:hypothetical protein JZX76_13600 [Haloarcula hispanica]|uniref:Uncharacterized protein n=1 Tax=Haloarcula hispanica TaxID=51589 RepID=A0A482TI94_HALHI|nr:MULTISPECIES: hypothetical protein [Haloarcula]KAA9408527.1 hypothetical protein EGO51_01540 [Haloarcula hispanica]KZX50244.1 hypothetical protein AV929_17015 [Haloarcula sp. K1]MCJ0620501.1 hypothetical protein [Haloarcula hispanica]RYJ10893.1 hypothetical protein ELS20_13485 [Haloarcula hispanica]
MRTKLFALYAAVGLALLAVGPGLAAAADSAGNTGAGNTLAVGVSQADDGSATVSVTQNETGVENASVAVESADNTSYAGTGNYTTDSDGTVGLPAPEQNVTVDVTATADNHTATTTADLSVAPENVTEFDTFGLEVSAYVSDLLSDENRTGGIGPAVASFVTANNPGNAPDHAGPPAHVTGANESDDNETHPSERQGPPADIFGDDENETENETDDRRGPPEDAGPPEDRGPDSDDDENETEDDRRGPPEDAGPPEDRDDDAENETEDDENETEAPDDETEESDDADEDDDDGGNGNNGNNGGNGGPPDDAGPPDERGN